MFLHHHQRVGRVREHEGQGGGGGRGDTQERRGQRGGEEAVAVVGPRELVQEPAQERDQGHLQAKAKVGQGFPSAAEEKAASVNIFLRTDKKRIVSEEFKATRKELVKVDGRNN